MDHGPPGLPLWVRAALLVVVAVVVLLLAVRCWQRGHKVLFVAGFFVPAAWLIGALLPPTR